MGSCIRKVADSVEKTKVKEYQQTLQRTVALRKHVKAKTKASTVDSKLNASNSYPSTIGKSTRHRIWNIARFCLTDTNDMNLGSIYHICDSIFSLFDAKRRSCRNENPCRISKISNQQLFWKTLYREDWQLYFMLYFT